MSNPNALASHAPAARGWLWLGLVALALYTAFLAANFANVAGGADSSGYLNSARLLASGRFGADLRTPPEFGPQSELNRQQFQPHGFVPFDGNPELSPTYPVGLPLHLALVGKIFGWSLAPVIVGVGGAVAALVLLYATARELGLSAKLAAAGAVVLAAYPVFLFTSIQPLSDTLATTWCLAAVLAALRARRQPAWAVGCGAALAMAVLVRATNAMLLPPLVVLLGFNARRLSLAVLGGLPGAVWLGYYNKSLYGGAFRSGYVDISEAFHLANAAPTVVHFAKWLALLLPTVLLVLPFAALARRETRTRDLLALALWFGGFAALYAFYDISREVWWCLRFILPGTPALILAALLGLDAITRARTDAAAVRSRTIAAAIIAAWAIGMGWFWTAKFHVLLAKTYEQAYADAAAEAQKQFPSNALVVAGLHSGALYYYTNFPVMRWEFVNAEEFAAFRAKTEKVGRPVCAVVFDIEEREALQKKCPGPWVKIGAVRNISLWRLGDPPRTGSD